MTKQIANNIIILLDRIEIKGHKERAVMNEIVTALEPFLNAEADQTDPPTDD